MASKAKIFTVLVLLMSAGLLHSQAFTKTVISAAHLNDINKQPLNGTIVITLTDSNNSPVTYTPQGGSPSTAPFTANVKNGLIQPVAGFPFAIPAAATTTPTGIVYRIQTIMSNSTVVWTLPLTPINVQFYSVDGYISQAGTPITGTGPPTLPHCAPGSQWTDTTATEVPYACSKTALGDFSTVWTQSPSQNVMCANGAIAYPFATTPYCIPANVAYALPGYVLGNESTSLIPAAPHAIVNSGGSGGTCTGALGQLIAIGADNACVGTPADWNVTNAASYTSPNPWLFVSPSSTSTPVTIRGATGGGFITPIFVQGVGGVSGGSGLDWTCTVSMTAVAVGHTLLVFDSNTFSNAFAVDGSGNSYTLADYENLGAIFFAANVTGGNTSVTIHNAHEVNDCWAEEWNSTDKVSPVDVAKISAATIDSGPVTTTFAHDILDVGMLADGTFTTPAGYTSTWISSPLSAGNIIQNAAQAVTSTGTYTATWTAGSLTGQTFMVALKALGSSSQTGDLVQYQDSGLNVLAGVNGLGQHFDPATDGLPSGTPDSGTYPWCFDTSDNTPCYWNGTSWVHIGSGSGAIGGTVSAFHTPVASAANTLEDSPDSWDAGLTTHTFISTTKEVHTTPEQDIIGTAGVGASSARTEGTEGCTPATGIDCVWSSVALHRVMQNPNNIGELVFPGLAAAIPAGHVWISGSSTWDPVDGGVISSCTNCLTTLPPGSNAAGTLQTAITAAAAGSTLILPASYAETPTSGITIAKALTLECQPGAAITRSANGNLITITASNVVIRGCKFNGGGFTGDTILATSVSGIQVLGNTILNGNGVGVFFSSVTNSRVQNNSVQSNNADDIVIFDASNNDVISNNLIDNSQDSVFSKGVSIHSNSVPSAISNITVANNTFKNRFGFVIEVGPFNGYMPTSINISGNVATQLSSTHAGSGTSGNFGGYSIFADTSATTGNSYTNESGQMAGLPGLEMFGQTHNASNNSITGAVATVYTTSSTFANNVIMQGNLTAVNGNNTGNPVIQQLSITGNVVNTSGVVPGNAWTASTALEQNYILKDTNGCLEKSIFRVSASSNLTGSTQPTWPACTQAAAGTITHDNNIDWMDLGPPMLPQLAAGTAYPGIELLCNTSGLTCGDYLVQGNKIIDNTVSTNQGFQDFAISGTTQKSTVFEGNQFVGWTTCYSVGTGLSPVLWMNDETGCGATGGVASAAHIALPTTTPTLTGAGGVTISGTWPNQTVTGSGSGGLSGMTAGQVPIAATATTVTSSKALAGAGTGIVTGPTSATATDIPVYTSTTGGLVDSGVAIASLAPLASPTFTGIPAAPTATVGTNTTQVATTAFVIANAGSGSAGVTLHGQGAPAAGTPATMTHVQSSPANTTAIFASNVTSGNLLVCSEQGESFYNPTSIPTDTVGTIYRSVAFYQNTGIIANQIWIGRAGGTGANTVTTNNSGTSVVISCDEFTAGTALVDIIATPVIGSTTPSTSVTTQTAGEMLYGSFTLARTGGTPSFTAGSGFVLGVSFGGSIGLSQNAVTSEYALGVTQGSHAIAMSASGSTAVDTTFVGAAFYASATGGCINGNWYRDDANGNSWGPCISGAIALGGALQANGNDVQFNANPFINPGGVNATSIGGAAIMNKPTAAGQLPTSVANGEVYWSPSPLSGGMPNAATYWTSSTTLGSLPFTWAGSSTDPLVSTVPFTMNVTGANAGITETLSAGSTAGLGLAITAPTPLISLTDNLAGTGTGGAYQRYMTNVGGAGGIFRDLTESAALDNSFNNLLDTWYATSSSNAVMNLPPGNCFGWNAGGTGGRNPADTGVCRDAAGTIDFGNGGFQDKTATINVGAMNIGGNAVIAPVSNAITSATAGSGATATCATASCTNLRGTYTVSGGTFTTGTLIALVWPTTTTAYVCTATMNGGVAFLGIGNSVATATGMNITAAVSVVGASFAVNYSCRP